MFYDGLYAQKASSTTAIPNVSILSKEDVRLMDKADVFFNQENYSKAIPIYQDLLERNTQEPYFKIKTAASFVLTNTELSKAITYFDELKEYVAVVPQITLYQAKAYHLEGEFEKAQEKYNNFLENNLGNRYEQLDAKLYAQQCQNAIDVKNSKPLYRVDNVGPTINTMGSEYVPVISSDGGILIFTYRGDRSIGGAMNRKLKADLEGEYYEDVFMSQRVGDNWLYPEGIDNINTKGHDATIALSADGQTLFLFKSTKKDGGDIYVSNLQGDTWSKPKKLNKNINTKYWEGSCSISADGQSLYFASERPGGFGGKDLYMSTLENGDWGKPINLGNMINTENNEDAPFIHADGKTLFFSSEGHSSIGGYDIMYAKLESSRWNTPNNIGMPINTPADDLFYVQSADGSFGLFSSDRKGGKGLQDIYIVKPLIEREQPVLAQISGIVKLDDKPVQTKLTIVNTSGGSNSRTIASNAATGRYLSVLNAGSTYQLTFSLPNPAVEPITETVDVSSIDQFLNIEYPIYFYSDKYKQEHPEQDLKKDSSDIQKKLETQLKKKREESTPEYYEEKTYKEILKKYGDQEKDQITYHIELGTYENWLDFDSTKIAFLGDIDSEEDNKGNTIFFFGPQYTLLNAEAFKYKVLAADSSLISKCLITINDQGQRKLIQEYYASEYNREGYQAPTLFVQKAIKPIMPKTDAEFEAILAENGNMQKEGLTFRVELASLKDTTGFKWNDLNKYGTVEKTADKNAITHYTIGNFKTLADAYSYQTILKEKSIEARKSLIIVDYEGELKTVKEYFQSSTSSIMAKSSSSSMPCSADALVDVSAFVGKDLNNKSIYNKFIALAGNYCADNLIFKIQIGAYRKPQNFKYPHLQVFGNAEVKEYSDNITRFTMREFKTLKEAEAFRQEVIEKGTKDAWITAIYDGKRMLLTELIAVNFYTKSIN